MEQKTVEETFGNLLNTPSELTGVINVGKVLSFEEELREKGYETDYDYRFSLDNAKHIVISGCARSGKTVLAMKIIKELIKDKIAKQEKAKILCLDTRPEWCKLEEVMDPQLITRYSCENAKINPWKIPFNISPIEWINLVLNTYCRCNGLLELGRETLYKVILSLYEETGAVEAFTDLLGSDMVSKRSKNVCFTGIVNRLKEKVKENTEDKYIYERLIEIMADFEDESSLESKLFGETDGLGVDELMKEEGITLIDFNYLSLNGKVKHFMKGVIASYFDMIANTNDTFVVEEIYEPFEFTPFMDNLTNNKRYSTILITQRISDLPENVIDNCDYIFAGKQKRPDDINMVIKKIPEDNINTIQDEDALKQRKLRIAIPSLPIGWFVTLEKGKVETTAYIKVSK